jgi:hypothetical protein
MGNVLMMISAKMYMAPILASKHILGALRDTTMWLILSVDVTRRFVDVSRSSMCFPSVPSMQHALLQQAGWPAAAAAATRLLTAACRKNFS